MENLLTSYLYTYKNCPLPTIGSLLVQPGSAIADYADKQIAAPVAAIRFVSKETSADELLKYISCKKNIDIQEASDQLSSYCDKLQEMQPYEEIPLGSAGSFYITTEGELHFKTAILSPVFFPDVPAVRVVHPDASHDMLVGDTSTNTTTMAGLLDQPESLPRPKWIWAALALGLAALAVLAVFFMKGRTGGFGNASSIEAKGEPATYQSSGK